jgi:hypothetical protein
MHDIVTPNVGRLWGTLAYIEANSDQWDQGDYRCKSGMCMAGWACERYGGRWIFPEPLSQGRDDWLVPEPEDNSVIYVMGDVRYVIAHDRAGRLLGLTEDQADDLFHPKNTLDDLRRIVEDICAAGAQP